MIRIKLFVATVLCVVVLASSLYIIATQIILEDYVTIEQSLMHKNLVRIDSVIKNYSSSLNIKLRDWAQWDDSYQFVSDHNETYVESNLADTTLVNLEINFIGFFDAEGQPVFSKLIDLEQEVEIPSDTLVAELTAHSDIYESIKTQSPISHILKTSGGILVLEGLPILPTDASAPARGILIFARFIDTDLTLTFAELTQLPLELFDATSPLPDAVSSALNTMRVTNQSFIEPFGNDRIAGYLAINDPHEDTILVVRATMPRDIYSQGVSTVTVFATVASLAILIFGFIILLFFEIILLRRLARLSKEMSSVSMETLDTATLQVGARDEIGQLVTRINVLITDLARAHKKEMAAQEQMENTLAQTEKLNRLMVDREIKMAELKKEITHLTNDKSTT